MPTLNYTQTVKTTNCISCGTIIGMAGELYNQRLQDHEWFYCPNGHHQYFSGESEAERLKRELQAQKDQTAREKHWREQADTRVGDLRLEKERVERRLRGKKSVVTRMKRRIVAGACVCCSRKFKDLERHMKSNHPDWSPDKAAEALAAKS